MPIVDAHHHLWSLEAVSYPWLLERGVERFFGDPTPIQQDYGVADFRRDQAGRNIAKSVHVQVGAAAGEEVAETRWLSEQSERLGLPTAIIAFCDLSSPAALSLIAEHRAISRALRGVRHIVSRHANEDSRNGSPGLLADPLFAQNLVALAGLGLSFDLQLTPPYLLEAARLFGRIPDLPVALCHAGSPWERDANSLREWTDGLAALAALPSTVCKLSGLGMFDRVWTVESLTPIVRTVLDIFGPDRVMWGSNFPVDKLYRSYVEALDAMLQIVPTPIHEPVFRGTAERFYRI